MLFSSLEFIFLFFPLSILIYALTPRRYKNVALLVSGLCFYGLGEPKYLPLMAAVILLDFAFGRLIARRQGRDKRARTYLWSAVVLNMGVLAFFKYFAPSGVELPIGISFYTFQALSYVLDVYHGTAEATESIVDFGAYVSLYPQLVAGPIVRYTDVARELKARTHSLSATADGLRRFCAGLLKKVLLANTAGRIYEDMLGDTSHLGAVIGVLAFALQIYFDFSGYSDMAIGMGHIFGFTFPENFKYPYAAQSITDFWRRWHITLSSFFREYVYIPLGGNRGGAARTVRNLTVTWALTGIWHGKGINFLMWGVYFAAVLIIEKFFVGGLILRLPRLLRHVYAIVLIGVGWAIFSAEGGAASALSMRLLGIGAQSAASAESLFALRDGFAFLAVAVIGCTPLPRRIYLRCVRRWRQVTPVLKIIFPTAALTVSVAYIISSGYNPFLYFRF